MDNANVFDRIEDPAYAEMRLAFERGEQFSSVEIAFLSRANERALDALEHDVEEVEA